MKPTTSIQKSARTAGIAYLLIIGTSILSMVIGPYRFIMEDDLAGTLRNMAEHSFVFRAGAAYDLLMYMGVIILSVALYRVLKGVDGSMALTALISRTGEALLGTATVLLSVMTLRVAGSEPGTYATQDLAAFLFDAKETLLNLVFAFLGFGSVLYCILFYRSRAIPRWLAGFGILAFSIVFSESILVILFQVESTVFTGLPAILFEITIGIWLLVKGVDNSDLQ